MNTIRFLCRGLLALGRLCRDVIFGIAVLMFMVGVGVLIYQIYVGLRHGEWPALLLPRLFEYLTPIVPWIEQPQSWHGLHTLITGRLAFTPISLFLIVTGTVIALVIEVLEASRQEYRALWRCLNTPFVILLLGVIATAAMVVYWDARQANRAQYQESNRYTLESLYRLHILIDNLPQDSVISAVQWRRTRAALTGQEDFAPLFREFHGLPIDGLIYYLTARFPQEQARLRGVRNTMHQLATFLAAPDSSTVFGSVGWPRQGLTPERQRTLGGLHTRLQRHVLVLEGFLRYQD